MPKTEKQRGGARAALPSDVDSVVAMLSAIVDSSFDAIVGKDLKGIVTSWNGAAEKMFGYTAAEMVGQSIVKIIPTALRSDEEMILSRIKRGERVEHFETVRVTKSGHLINVSVTVSPIKNSAGEIVGASKTVRDITERKQAEAVLSESEERFRTMANSIPQLAWIAQPDGRVSWYNQRWHDYTGKSLEEMESGGRQSLHDANVLPIVLERWNTAIATGQTFEMEFPLRGADGEFRTFLTRAQPLKNAEGAVLQWFGTSTDVGVLKHLENSLRSTQERLSSTLGAASVGTWTWDIPNNVLVADEFTSRIFSMDPAEAAKGKPVELYFEALHDDDRSIVADDLATAIKSCGNYEVEFRVRQSDGEYLWLLSRGRVEGDSNGVAAFFHGAVMDITEHKRAQSMIQTLNVELELRVIERTAQLEDAVKELEAFSYSVSHDLRGPLRTMNGFSKAVLEDYGELLPEEGRKYLLHIRSGAKKMATLIDDLLAFAKTSHQPMKRREVDTDKLVRAVLAELMRQQATRQIEVTIGELPPCFGDRALLRQVWINLLSNALKYTQKRYVATVEIGSESRPEGDVYFVRDNGAGFDMKYADKLFSVFQRFHSVKDFEGSGVGLATVYRIVKRHGGEIWAEAEEDKGATFYFTLGAVE